jgi:hypothetical protein
MSFRAQGSTPSQREVQDVASVHRAEREPNILPAGSRHLPDVWNNPEQLHSEAVRRRRDDFGSANARAKGIRMISCLSQRTSFSKPNPKENLRMKHVKMRLINLTALLCLGLAAFAQEV